MTILEALKANVGYDDTNLLGKVLVDNNLDGTDTYVSATHKNAVDVASADAYEVMATLPEFKQGNSYSKWDSVSLRASARSIRKRLGLTSSRAKIKGTPIW